MGDALAGILGGSGTHVVQIIVVIVVAAVLIGYFVLRLVGRGGDDVGAVATAVSRHDGETSRAHDRTVPDATLRLSRAGFGIGIGAQSAQWNIAIDGTMVGSIANKETVEVSVEPGHHTLRLGSGRQRSAERSFDVAQDEVVGFRCHGPRMWPMLVAALINPDLWISLRRE